MALTAEAPAEASTQGRSDAEKIAWVVDMRRAFSPDGMLHEDGSINQDFFKPKRVVIIDDKKWGNAEKELLYKGLEEYGVGKWREISERYLPKWDDQSLRVKAARLLGSQSLARYVGWKGDRAAVDAEREKNHRIGQATGCWKGGVLVEDDAGSVAKYIAEHQL